MRDYKPPRRPKDSHPLLMAVVITFVIALVLACLSVARP